MENIFEEIMEAKLLEYFYWEMGNHLLDKLMDRVRLINYKWLHDNGFIKDINFYEKTVNETVAICREIIKKAEIAENQFK
jgi:hypothetical protein